jgi:hypothetical protein
LQDYSATHICSAAFPAAKRNISARFTRTSVLPKYLGLTNEQVLLLSDIFPTGYKAAEMDHFAIRFEVTTSHAASL